MVCLLLWQIPVGLAQDDGESEYQILGINALPALPSVISFRVILMAPPDKVQSIKLDAEQEDGIQISETLDVEAALLVQGESVSEYQYTIELQEITDLRLFQALDYTFTVDIEGLEEPLIQSDQIIVEHQAAGRWLGANTADLHLHWNGERFAGDSYLQDLQPVMNLLKIQTGYDKPVGFVVYDPNKPLCEQVTLEDGTLMEASLAGGLVFTCNREALQRLYANDEIVFTEIDSPQPQLIVNTLTETLVNTVYQPRWGNAEIPSWFQAGLGWFYAYNGQSNMLPIVQRASQQDQLLSLPQLTTSENRNPLWEAQAYLLVLYLAETYGATAPFDIALAMNRRVDFTEALQTVTEDSIERIYAAWTIWINSPRAAEVIFWNPYQATTPTPTPSFTPTDIPPSPTTRPSPTISPTPSRIPLYVPSVELATRALPTFRPTVSVTPLPPGYFDTPTAAPPTLPVKDDKSSGGVCGTGIGAMIIPIVGLLVARRKRHD